LFGVSPVDVLVLGMVIILLFGPDKLPEIIRAAT
jgi:sec-independent protein translocase protein TatB